MEQAAAKTKAVQTAEHTPATMVRKIGKTTYKVCIHFSQTSKETMEDKRVTVYKDGGIEIELALRDELEKLLTCLEAVDAAS